MEDNSTGSEISVDELDAIAGGRISKPEKDYIRVILKRHAKLKGPTDKILAEIAEMRPDGTEQELLRFVAKKYGLGTINEEDE